MNSIIQDYTELAFSVRVSIVLFVLVFVTCKVFGRTFLRVLSLIPFVLRKLFRVIYLGVEMPISFLHSIIGNRLYSIDNHMAYVGKKIDSGIYRWYMVWHKPKKITYGKLIAIYLICIILIVFSSHIKTADNIETGERLFLKCESTLLDILEEKEWYTSQESALISTDTQDELIDEEQEKIDIVLVVSGVSNSLRVRDTPSIDNSETLERLHNGDEVAWDGKLVFTETSNGRVEAWAKVITENGIEGWSKFYYLHPKEYESEQFYVSPI